MTKLITITSHKRFIREWPEIIEALQGWATEQEVDLTQFAFKEAFTNPANPKQIIAATWYPVDFEPERLTSMEKAQHYRYEWISYDPAEQEEPFVLVGE